MKRMLTLAAAVLAASVVGYAQEAETIKPQPFSVDLPTPGITRPQTEEPSGSVSAAEQEYVWQTQILRRFDGGNDTNRQDFFVPRTFPGGTTEWRGIGQIFSPRVIYSFYHNSRIYDENSQVLISSRFPDGAFQNDQEYVEQFKDAKTYSIDSLQFFVYKNSNSIPENNGKITVFKTNFDFNSSAYKDTTRNTQGAFKGGFAVSRNSLTSVYSRLLMPEELDTTIQDNGSGQLTISARRERFDPPLVFGATESAIILYSNDEAPSLEQLPQDADVQAVIGSLEYRQGDLVTDPNSGQIVSDDRRDPIDYYKSLGVVLYKTKSSGAETIISAWTGLISNNKVAVLDVNMVIWGVVEIQSGVNYHFGADATSQGLGNITPNPVTTNSRLPFSLTELADVQIDLYDVNGRMVKNLVSAQRWVPGNYSVELPVNDLENGAYLVRMTANGKPYSMKFTVAR